MYGYPPPGFRQSEPSTAAIIRCFSSRDWTSNCPKRTPPPLPPPALGSLGQAQPPSKDATPAVIGHQTTYKGPHFAPNPPPPPPGFRQFEPSTAAIKGCYSSCDWTSNYLYKKDPFTPSPPLPGFRQSGPSTAAIKGCYSSCDWTSNYL